MKRLILTALAVLALALGGASNVLAYPTGSDANHASNWNNQFPHPAVCYKHEAGDDSAHGFYSDDGKTFTLNVFNQSWPGDHWEAIIVKAGSGDAANLVTVHPSAGVPYAAQQGKDISHVIVCKGTTPEQTAPPTAAPTPEVTPSAPPATASPQPSVPATASPAPSATPLITEAPSSSPSPGASFDVLPSFPNPTQPATDASGAQASSGSRPDPLFWIGLLTIAFVLSYVALFARRTFGGR